MSFNYVPFKAITFSGFINSCQLYIDSSITRDDVEDKITDYLRKFREHIAFTKNPALIHTKFRNKWRRWTQPWLRRGVKPYSKLERECLKIKMACEAIKNPLIGFLYNYPILESLSSYLSTHTLLRLEKVRNTQALSAIIKKRIDEEDVPLDTLFLEPQQAVEFAKKYRLSTFCVGARLASTINVIASLPLERIIIEYGEVDNEDLIKLTHNTRLKSLTLFKLDITSRTLESFTNLKQLNLVFNDIEDITPIYSLTNLEQLALSCHNSIGSLAKLTRLYTLDLFDTDFSNIDDLQNLTRLEHLALPSNFRCKNMEKLCAHTTLKVLSMPDCKDLNDHTVTHFTKLTNLEKLNTWGSEIQDEGLKSIGELTQLEYLDIGQIGRTTRSGWSHFAKLTRLKTLNLYLEIITYKKVKHLKNLPLEYLSFDCSLIIGPPRIARSISKLTSLRTLIFSQRNFFTDAEMKHFSKLTLLRELAIPRSQITDIGLEYLTNLLNLQKLNIKLTNTTEDGITKLTNLQYLTVSHTGIDCERLWSKLTTLRQLKCGDHTISGRSY